MKNNIDEMLRKIAAEIQISKSEFEKAERSYSAVGEYIAGKMPEFDVKVIPQGSFRLGTVIKPISDKDDYDIDLVVIIKNKFLKAKELKNSVGDIIKSHKIYSENLTEGKRCWTIEYAEGSNYHLDILPTMPSDTYETEKELIMTHRADVESEYVFKSTNPEKYYEWFLEKMQQEKEKLKQEYAVKNKKEIVDVPEYEIKTNLQIAIQLIKRYRDIMFKENSEVKPISIILTTIMTKVYTGTENIYELIQNFSNEYQNYIEIDENGEVKIENPVDSEENFADKWKENPEKQKAFFEFMKKLKEELIENKLLLEGDKIKQSEVYKKCFGDNIIEKVYKKIANETLEKREKSELYMKENGNITTEKTQTQVKGHTFFGK